MDIVRAQAVVHDQAVPSRLCLGEGGTTYVLALLESALCGGVAETEEEQGCRFGLVDVGVVDVDVPHPGVIRFEIGLPVVVVDPDRAVLAVEVVVHRRGPLVPEQDLPETERADAFELCRAFLPEADDETLELLKSVINAVREGAER